MAETSMYEQDFERRINGVKFVGERFFDSRAGCKIAAKELRDAGLPARTIVLSPTSRTGGGSFGLIGGFVERYLLMLPWEMTPEQQETYELWLLFQK